ncbi:hypothetical protein N7513_012344 [Penicillium frequentans]|nr:hypothetical protein N7513_012344 [Penicillium glabrum]
MGAQSWTSGPNGRGTLDILWTCLSTLALCAWTAVHPNVPLVYRFWAIYSDRVGLMALAIVFPEIIISSALTQRRLAQRLLRVINQTSWTSRLSSRVSFPPDQSNQDDSALYAVPSTAKSLDTGTTQPWALNQALFAVMGGFSIITPYIDRNSKKITVSRLVSAEGISILAQTGFLPEISASEVDERSNADIFAKGLVLLQIIWFALQVIGRLAQGLSVTPLETHTIIHVGCTILLYAIWLHKPYNLTQSIQIPGEEIKDIGALFNFYDMRCAQHHKECESFRIRQIEYWKERVIMAARGNTGYAPPPQLPEMIPVPRLLEKYINTDLDSIRAESLCDDSTWILHAIAPSALRGLHMLESKGCTFFQQVHERAQTLDLLQERMGNFTVRNVWGSWSRDIGHEPSLDKGFHVLFNLLYGGGHLAAWNAYFPTSSERWLWRISALALTTVPAWGALWILWWMGVRSHRQMFYPIRNGDLDIIAAPMFFTVMMIYTVARCYFVVESLASLRLLPADAYQTVSWTSVIPHIS